MRKILRIAALTLTLCAPAFADDGDIPTPPKPSSITVLEEPMSAGGEMEAVDSISETALYLLESVLALF